MIDIIDGIAYEDGNPIILHIVEIEPKSNHQLVATFQDGTIKLYDFTPLLKKPAFKPLADVEKFNHVILDHGIPTWEEENLDLSPETIYSNSTTIDTLY